MALLFMDSFSAYVIADILRKWSAKSDTAITWALEATGGRNSRPCLKQTTTAQGTKGYLSIAPLAKQNTVWAPTASGVLGFAIKVTDLSRIQASSSVASGLVRIFDGADVVLGVQLNSSGTFTVFRGDSGSTHTSLGTSVQGLQSDVWSFFEFEWLIHASAGTAKIRVDGVEVFSFTGDTLTSIGGATGTWNAAAILGVPGVNGPTWLEIRVCDFYLCDLSGSLNNTFLGDVTVAPIKPNGAGNSSGFTPSAGSNYQCVDEATADDDTTYVSGASPTTRDTYAFESVPSGATIKAFQINVLARKAAEGAAQIKGVVRHSGSDNDFTAALGIGSTSYAYVTFPYDSNPGTGSAISESDANAAEFGLVKTT